MDRLALVLFLGGLWRCLAQHEAIVGSFGVYPGYTGDLSLVSGVMSVTSEDGVQTLSWSLSNIDSRCSETCTATNCCGVHIHEGMTCSVADSVGGHYWNSTTYTTDPWLTVMYNASSDPSLETSLAVPTGLMGSDILGRAMVIHDFTGARIACGLIHKATVSGFRTYPGYTGDLRTKGSMLVTSADGKQTLSWIFTGGVDASCNASACTAANCCGVHIHVGMDCSDAATVGGHYWNAEAYTTDPWLTVRYSAENVPAVASGVVVATGYDTANINKRAMVIHDFNGGRIACAPIQMPVSSAIVASWSPYPGTTYSGTVDGVMSVISSEDAMGTQTLSWSLTGLDQNCSMTCTATNCCGVHIHVGTDCSDATTIGGHYWDSSDYNTDPWLVIMYNSSSSGGALATDVAVATGLSAADVLGRAMVIHDFTGARIACGIIGLANVPSFSPYPTYTGSLMTAGNMAVTSLEGVQTLSWILTAGLDTQCMGTCSATNCCGVHIHAGTDCTDASTVGGHYYDSNALASDPWLTITYDASEMPSVKKDVMVTTGLNTADVTGHTMVIHDYSGGRIACGIISLDMEPTMSTTVPDGTSTIPISGAASYATAVAAAMIFLAAL